MKTKKSQVLTAADIDNRLQEQFADDYENHRFIPDWLADYIADVPDKEVSDWERAVFGKKERRGGRNTKRNASSTETGSWGFPASAGLRSEPVPADSCPLTNRAATTYQNQSPIETTAKYPQRLGGYDGGCEIGFEGIWDNPIFTALKEQLEPLKNAGAENMQDIETVIGGKAVFLKPTGAKVGDNVYSFIFVFGGVTFFIHRNPKGGIQPVRVRYGAAPLIQYGLFAVHKAVLDFLSSIGFTVTKEKISRLDMQVMVEQEASDFFDLIGTGHVVKRATKWNLHGKSDGVQTYTLGSISNGIELCIYDKKEELWECNVKDPVKFKLMIEHCIGEESFFSDRPLTRVEFRLRRDTLRRLGFDTVTDLQNNERGLADWLTSNWFRLLKEPKVRGHENTAELHPLWLEVRAAFFKWFNGSANDEPVKWHNPEPVSCDTTALEKQAAGCLAKAAALRFGKQENKGTAQNIFRMLLDSYASVMFDKVNDITHRVLVMSGVRLGVSDDDVGNACVADGSGWERFMGLRNPLVLQR